MLCTEVGLDGHSWTVSRASHAEYAWQTKAASEDTLNCPPNALSTHILITVGRKYDEDGETRRWKTLEVLV